MNDSAMGVGVNVFTRTMSVETGEILETFEGHNMVQIQGLYCFLQCLHPTFPEAKWKLDTVRFSKSNQPNGVVWGDTTIGTPWIEKAITNTQYANATTPQGGLYLSSSFELAAEDFNGNEISEMSLWVTGQNADATPESKVLFSKIKRAPINKTSAIRIEGLWVINLSVIV